MLPLLEAFRKDLYHCADCNYCVDAVWAERGIEHVCPTMQSHSPVTSMALTDLKACFDPRGILSPGNLGLGSI